MWYSRLLISELPTLLLIDDNVAFVDQTGSCLEQERGVPSSVGDPASLHGHLHSRRCKDEEPSILTTSATSTSRRSK